jgi:alkaline phosphatase
MMSMTGLGMVANLRRSAKGTSGSFVDTWGGRFNIAGMKWRNQLLALFCLLVFVGFGILYFRLWVVQKPFGIILFVGEGLSPSRLAATRIYSAGADTPLAIDSLSFSALLTNHSRDFAVADEAAAATAFATGMKVNNRSIGLDPNGKALTDLFELARETGRATGLVTDRSLTNPTASAFWTHATAPSDPDKIARDLALNGMIDIALGGGAQNFVPTTKGGQRKDEADLLLETRRNGFDVVRTKAELESIPGWRRQPANNRPD